MYLAFAAQAFALDHTSELVPLLWVSTACSTPAVLISADSPHVIAVLSIFCYISPEGFRTRENRERFSKFGKLLICKYLTRRMFLNFPKLRSSKGRLPCNNFPDFSISSSPVTLCTQFVAIRCQASTKRVQPITSATHHRAITL